MWQDLLLPMRRAKATDGGRMHPEEPRPFRLGLPPPVHHLDNGGLLLGPQRGSTAPDPPAGSCREQPCVRALADHRPFALGTAAHHLPQHPTPYGLFALDMSKRLPIAQMVPIGLASLDRKDRFSAQPRVRAPPAKRSTGGLEASALLDHTPRPAVSFS
jgi:hypothetical protein